MGFCINKNYIKIPKTRCVYQERKGFTINYECGSCNVVWRSHVAMNRGVHLLVIQSKRCILDLFPKSEIVKPNIAVSAKNTQNRHVRLFLETTTPFS